MIYRSNRYYVYRVRSAGQPRDLKREGVEALASGGVREDRGRVHRAYQRGKIRACVFIHSFNPVVVNGFGESILGLNA